MGFEWPNELCYVSSVNDNVAIPPLPSRHAMTLNMVGLIVLLVGLVSAGIIFCVGQTRSVQRTAPAADGEWRDGTLSTEDSKIAIRRVEQFGGPVQVLMVKFNDALKNPASQALLIVATSTLVALGCFLAARRLSPAPQGVIANR